MSEQHRRTLGLTAAANAANTPNNNNTFDCLLHGQNPTHNTDACSFLQNTAKEERDKAPEVLRMKMHRMTSIWMALAHAHNAQTAPNTAICDSGTTHNMFQATPFVFDRKSLPSPIQMFSLCLA
jgi:hypothetical protein